MRAVGPSSLIDPRHVSAFRRRLFAGAMLALAVVGAHAQASAPSLQKAQESAPVSPASMDTTNRFDGDWTIHLDCPSNTESSNARGYAYDFPASVLNGRLFGSQGQQGAPASLEIEGQIAPGGDALLQARGRTGDPQYTIKRADRGTPYSYDVQAHFDANSGSGKRVQDRVCNLRFTRR